VGRDHRDWITQEKGVLGVGALRAVKAQLDPSGIMSPGKLL
jgi:alkyldihydroxyacetonephosphate synthase